jgi:molybdate transport system substrate-binding protein
LRACALLLVAVAFAVAACGGGSDPLTVFAAASLANVLPKIDDGAHYSFGGSDDLAAQIREGAPADVYASASPKYPAELHAAGLAGAPRVFATNRLVAIVRRGYTGDLSSLAQPGVKVVMAAEGVPAGDYARQALQTLGADGVLHNVVSEEDDVKGVVTKVALGEADAGFVYATDVKPVAKQVRVLDIPASAQPRIEYSVAVVHESEQADDFVRRLLGADGRATLHAEGFGAP